MRFLVVLGFCGARRLGAFSEMPSRPVGATDVNSVGGELAARKFGGLVGEYIYAYVMRISRCLFAALFLRRIWRARIMQSSDALLLREMVGESLDFLARGAPTMGEERGRSRSAHSDYSRCSKIGLSQ